MREFILGFFCGILSLFILSLMVNGKELEKQIDKMIEATKNNKKDK